MRGADALAAALSAAEQALSAASDGRDELNKLQSVLPESGAATLMKIADQLEDIHAGLSLIDTSMRKEAAIMRRVQ